MPTRVSLKWLITKRAMIPTFCWFLFACTPRVEVAVPDKPITINLNVKIEHEVRIKVDKELDDLFSEQDDIF